MVWRLKYGLNPHQGDAQAIFADGPEWLHVLNGDVGYVNLLDALRACKVCLTPQTVPLTWTVAVRPLDRERAKP